MPTTGKDLDADAALLPRFSPEAERFAAVPLGIGPLECLGHGFVFTMAPALESLPL